MASMSRRASGPRRCSTRTTRTGLPRRCCVGAGWPLPLRGMTAEAFANCWQRNGRRYRSDRQERRGRATIPATDEQGTEERRAVSGGCPGGADVDPAPVDHVTPPAPRDRAAGRNSGLPQRTVQMKEPTQPAEAPPALLSPVVRIVLQVLAGYLIGRAAIRKSPACWWTSRRSVSSSC